jgi:hypothetical protein
LKTISFAENRRVQNISCARPRYILRVIHRIYDASYQFIVEAVRINSVSTPRPSAWLAEATAAEARDSVCVIEPTTPAGQTGHESGAIPISPVNSGQHGLQRSSCAIPAGCVFELSLRNRASHAGGKRCNYRGRAALPRRALTQASRHMLHVGREELWIVAKGEHGCELSRRIYHLSERLRTRSPAKGRIHAGC